MQENRCRHHDRYPNEYTGFIGICVDWKNDKKIRTLETSVLTDFAQQDSWRQALTKSGAATNLRTDI
jgi:hypothetical protein